MERVIPRIRRDLFAQHLPNRVDPKGPFVLRFNVKHPLDDRGQLQTANDESVGSRTIHRHYLAARDGEVVGGLTGHLSIRQILVADQRAIAAQDEVASTPVLDVLAALKQPTFLDDLTRAHVDVSRQQIRHLTRLNRRALKQPKAT